MMGGLFGKSISTSDPVISGLQIQQSGYGVAIPIVYGLGKVSPNLIQYADWTAIPNTQTSGGGGKGGGSTISNTTYTYSATVVLGMCEGPISGTGTIWRNNSAYGSAALAGLTVFNGTYPQTPWGFMTTNHPTQAVGYQGVGYLCGANYTLGTGSLGSHTVEVQGVFYNSAGLYPDANPSNVITDFLTNANYGCGFPGAYIGPTTAMSAYCVANNIYISPVLLSQQQAAQWISEWAQIANVGTVWSEGLLKLIPYGGTASVCYNLTDDDFIVSDNEDPVVMTRSKQADAFNDVMVEFLDRGFQYSSEIAEAKDQANIEAYGIRTQPTNSLHSICIPATARTVAQTILQRVLYIRNNYEFKLSLKYCLLEPMDVVTLTDTGLGLNQAQVRIIEIDESADGILTVKAEEYNPIYCNPQQYGIQAALGYQPNYATVPSIDCGITVFHMPSALGANTLGIAVTNLDANYGGCQLWMSYDNTTFFYIGKMTGSSAEGVTTANLASYGGSDPDNTSTLTINMSLCKEYLNTVNATTFNLYETLCLVGNEFLAFETATTTGSYTQNLTTMHRGLYGSTQGSTTGARFVYCDNRIFEYAYNPSLIGSTVYFKAVAYNSVGGGLQDISALPSTSFTI